MGSHRNTKNYRNNHRHVFRKRKSPLSKKQQGLNNSVFQTGETSVMMSDQNAPGTIDGSRIMNLNKFKDYTDELTLHASCCKGPIILKGETRFRLASILAWQCSKCPHTITLENSPKVKGVSR